MSDIFYKSTDGLDLYARSYGPEDAPLTALCMHGLTRNHKDFEPMIAALGGTYRFIAVDVRGRGQSDRTMDAETYTPMVYARDMLTLLDHLRLSRVALIGTSMGGLMAMLMAKSAPDRFSGIVLNDVGPVVERAGLERIAAYASDPKPVESWCDAISKTKASQGAAFPDYGDEDWSAFAKRTWKKQPDGRLELDYDPEITNSLAESKPGLLTRIVMWRVFSSLKKIPLLVVRGGESDILSQKIAARMIRRHKDAELAVVPGRGHAPMLDEPAAVSAISAFLKRIETQS